MQDTKAGHSLADRLAAGPVICAEGYLFELERRGYVRAGAFVPEVVLEHPEEVEALHREFVHAGSDVVEAFTYYAHREKLRQLGKEDQLEPMNRQALEIAGTVARETGTLLAGNICNTNAWDPHDESAQAGVRRMFAEQVGWAAEAGVDLVIGETISFAGEALAALAAIKDAGLPAVVTIGIHQEPRTMEGWTPLEACQRLFDAGADVVGLNCHRGPRTMLPLLDELVTGVSVPVAALPVPYRTTPTQPTFQSLRDPGYDRYPDGRPFPTGLDPFTCTRYEVADFTAAAADMGVRWFGLCCGGAPHHVRAMAETLGRKPAASRYHEDMSQHAYFGAEQTVRAGNRALAEQL
ncbi:MAG: homocysteine S-methyltransferase family protein [Egibacteraceae bacterium]